jgi:hypothetical protein
MTGAATAEPASNAAEIVFNMVVSSFKGIERWPVEWLGSSIMGRP